MRIQLRAKTKGFATGDNDARTASAARA